MDTFPATHNEASKTEPTDFGTPTGQKGQRLADYQASMHDFHRLLLDHHSLLQQHLQDLCKHARLYLDLAPDQKRSHVHHSHQQLLQEHRQLLHYHQWLQKEHCSWLQQMRPNVLMSPDKVLREALTSMLRTVPLQEDAATY